MLRIGNDITFALSFEVHTFFCVVFDKNSSNDYNSCMTCDIKNNINPFHNNLTLTYPGAYLEERKRFIFQLR